MSLMTCTDCHGLGLKPSGTLCPTCQGRRVVLIALCSQCDGSGTRWDTTCSYCEGSGYSAIPKPLSNDPKILSSRQLTKALDNTLNGTPTDDYAEGVVLGLVEAARDKYSEPLRRSQWVNSIVKRGHLIIDADGIWHYAKGVGVRVVAFKEDR